MDIIFQEIIDLLLYLEIPHLELIIKKIFKLILIRHLKIQKQKNFKNLNQYNKK